MATNTFKYASFCRFVIPLRPPLKWSGETYIALITFGFFSVIYWNFSGISLLQIAARKCFATLWIWQTNTKCCAAWYHTGRCGPAAASSNRRWSRKRHSAPTTGWSVSGGAADKDFSSVTNGFALQIQFIWFLLHGTHHILLDKTRWRHVAAHRHQVIAVQGDHRADSVWSHGHQFLSLLYDSDGGQLVCPSQAGGTLAR